LLRLIVGGKRTLVLGLPSICGLTVGELAAILTHEYGHIGHRDTQWAALIGTLRTSLVVTLGTIPGPANLEAQPLLIALVAAFNPAYWTLRAFVALFLRVTGEFSRARETLADLEAATRFGGAVFDRALLRVAANDVVFRELVVERDVRSLLRYGRTIDGFVSWMDQIYRDELGPGGLTQIEYRLLETGGEHRPGDLHPGLTERIAATARMPGDELADDRPVEVLFDNWPATDEAVTRLYYDSVTSDLTAV
jgi:Zn-dependent protease with chaperone function